MFSNVYNRDSSDVLECVKARKNSFTPFYPTGKEIKLMLVDNDHFPYRRFFRGEYDNPEPVIHGRYGGYRPYMNYGCALNCKNLGCNK
jgi:hypothetical protein